MEYTERSRLAKPFQTTEKDGIHEVTVSLAAAKEASVHAAAVLAELEAFSP